MTTAALIAGPGQYFTHLNQLGYVQVEAESIRIPGLESLDLFIHQHNGKENWGVSEGWTGLGIGSGGPTREAALALATQKLQTVGSLAVRILIQEEIAAGHLSPRGRYLAQQEAQQRPPYYEITIVGEPAPWTVWTRKAHPPKSYGRMLVYQGAIQDAVREAEVPMLEGPIWLSFSFQRGTPEQGMADEAWQARGILKRPDLTNYIKAAEDALKGLVFKDDAQVTEIIAQKLYSDMFLQGVTLIRVEEIGGVDVQGT